VTGSLIILHCEEKNAPVYFCNDIVNAHGILIIFDIVDFEQRSKFSTKLEQSSHLLPCEM